MSLTAATLENSLTGPQNSELLYDPEIPFLGMDLRELKTRFYTNCT